MWSKVKQGDRLAQGTVHSAAFPFDPPQCDAATLLRKRRIAHDLQSVKCATCCLKVVICWKGKIRPELLGRMQSQKYEMNVL